MLCCMCARCARCSTSTREPQKEIGTQMDFTLLMHFVPAYPVRRCSSCRCLHWSVTVLATPPHRIAKHRQCCHVDHVVDYRSSIIIIIIFSGISFVVQSFVCYLTQVNCVVYVASMRAVRVHCAGEELANGK